MPIAVYLATKFWMYYVWFAYAWPYVNSAKIMIPFTVNSLLLMYNFYKAWKTDPGVITSTREERIKV